MPVGSGKCAGIFSGKPPICLCLRFHVSIINIFLRPVKFLEFDEFIRIRPARNSKIYRVRMCNNQNNKGQGRRYVNLLGILWVSIFVVAG